MVPNGVHDIKEVPEVFSVYIVNALILCVCLLIASILYIVYILCIWFMVYVNIGCYLFLFIV